MAAATEHGGPDGGQQQLQPRGRGRPRIEVNVQHAEALLNARYSLQQVADMLGVRGFHS